MKKKSLRLSKKVRFYGGCGNLKRLLLFYFTSHPFAYVTMARLTIFPLTRLFIRVSASLGFAQFSFSTSPTSHGRVSHPGVPLFNLYGGDIGGRAPRRTRSARPKSLAVYRVQLQTTFISVGFSSFNAFPLLVLTWGVLTHNRSTDLQTLAFLVCDHSVRLSNSPAGSISFI